MKPHKDLSDDELLRLIKAGDESAFASLYQRRHAGIYRFALQMCGSQTLAEDVTQEVFLVLIRQTESFNPARGSLNSFLYGIARYQILRRLRRERFYAPLGPEAVEDEALPITFSKPLEDLARNETIESVRRAVLSLPARYREVIVLCDLEEMSYVETAGVLGCAVGTVRSRVHRGRTLLLEKLRPKESEEASAEEKTARCFA